MWRVRCFRCNDGLEFDDCGAISDGADAPENITFSLRLMVSIIDNEGRVGTVGSGFVTAVFGHCQLDSHDCGKSASDELADIRFTIRSDS